MAIPGGETNVQEPTLIERLLGCEVVQVACGEYHSLARARMSRASWVWATDAATRMNRT